MPHARDRHLVPLLLKRLKFSPIIAIQGVRQCGKSFLARNTLREALKSLTYKTLDMRSDWKFADENPESFLAQSNKHSLFVIDEVQKVPHLFDSMKAVVDQDRRPGQFLILGSTEFSRLTKIRESLTGRLSRVKLYPFTIGEALDLDLSKNISSLAIKSSPRVTRAQLLRHLERGGFPGIFSVRSTEEFNTLLKDWLELTVQRDIHMFPKVSADSTLARTILEAIAKLDEPNVSAIAKYCRRDPRKIRKHLEILQALFVLDALEPHSLGTGKTRYFLCDTSLVGLLGGSFERKLETWILQEIRAQYSYSDIRDRKLSYYRTTKGAIIHFVEEGQNQDIKALKVISREDFNAEDLRVLTAFREKTEKPAILYAAAPANQKRSEGISVIPWESFG